MKKPITIILNILSIISAAILVILAAFCAYDWITISNTTFAYSIDFWLVIDYYAVGMLIFAAATFVFSLPDYLINRKDEAFQKSKKLSAVLSILSAICIVISIILYFLPFEINI